MKLQHRLFIEALLKGRNATEAAIAAGYSAKTAKQQGSRLLTNVDIVAEINRIGKKVEERTEITAEWVLNSLRSVAERCMTAEPVMEKINGQIVPTGEYQFDSSGANKALDLLGKNLNLWKDVGSKENPLTGAVTVTMSKEDAAL